MSAYAWTFTCLLVTVGMLSGILRFMGLGFLAKTPQFLFNIGVYLLSGPLYFVAKPTYTGFLIGGGSATFVVGAGWLFGNALSFGQFTVLLFVFAFAVACVGAIGMNYSAQSVDESLRDRRREYFITTVWATVLWFWFGSFLLYGASVALPVENFREVPMIGSVLSAKEYAETSFENMNVYAANQFKAAVEYVTGLIGVDVDVDISVGGMPVSNSKDVAEPTPGK